MDNNINRLDQKFFNRNCIIVAKELLGKILIWDNYQGIITETESYRGSDDPASHAFKGPTPRAKIMFGPAGRTYVYLIYGIYHCLNIVTEGEGFASAVLIRGLKLIRPIEEILNGPGKLCKRLNITKDNNNIDLITSSDFYVGQAEIITKFNNTARIGIKVGLDKLWRFAMY